MTFQQSQLPQHLIGKAPRELTDLAEGEIVFAHPMTLVADVYLNLWMKLSSTVYRKPKMDWQGGYLIVRLIPGGVEVDINHMDEQWRIIPSPFGGENYRRLSYLPVQLGTVDAGQ